MWARFRHYFKGFPAQEKVAQLAVMYGLRVHQGSVYAGDIKLSDTAMARAAGVLSLLESRGDQRLGR